MIRSKLEEVARAICLAVEENPAHIGDAQGHEFRWQDYLPVAEKALEACDKCEKEAKDFFTPIDEVVALLNGGGVMSLDEKKQFDEFKELSNAINMGLPIWPTKWSQDVAALAFFIHELKEKAPNEAHGTPKYKDFVQLAHQQGLMPWYDINWLEKPENAH